MNPILGGALIGAGSSIVSNLFGRKNASDANDAASAASAAQWQREYGAYKTRYQDTMSDMRSAGLNPILAASGGFNVGSGPSASKAQTFQAPAVSYDAASSALALSQRKKVDAETQTETNKQDLLKNQANESLEKAKSERARQGLMTEQENLAAATIFQVEANVNKLAAEVERIQSQTSLNKQQKNNLLTAKDKMAKEIDKIGAQLAQLQNTSDVYKHPIGQYLTWAKEIMSAAGLPLLMLGAGGWMAKALRYSGPAVKAIKKFKSYKINKNLKNAWKQKGYNP